MKNEGKVVQVKSVGAVQGAQVTRNGFGESSPRYMQKAMRQAEQASTLDVCEMTKPSKVRMVGPCA